MSQQTLSGFGFFSPSRSNSAKRKLDVESGLGKCADTEKEI